MQPDELMRSILAAHAAGDTPTLERLQAEYRTRSDTDCFRGGPPPQLVYRDTAGADRTRSKPASSEVPLMRIAGDRVRSSVAPTRSSKSTSSLTPAARAARIAEITDGVPELRVDAKPTVTVSLSVFARRTIETELMDSLSVIRDHLAETGGWLFGGWEQGKWLMSATGLGDGEMRSKSVVLDFDLARHEVYRANLGGYNPRHKFLGCWHVHPIAGSTSPSGTDRRNALRGLDFKELNPADFAVDLIVSPHERRGWISPQYHAWATRRDRWAGPVTEPVTIKGPTR
jgi:hypothetical protein